MNNDEEIEDEGIETRRTLQELQATILNAKVEADDARFHAKCAHGEKMYIRAQEMDDPRGAAVCYRFAANAGHDRAMYQLGILHSRDYRGGAGVLEDYVLAHMWLNMAAARGHDEAATALSALASKMTREQIAEAQKLAREWKSDYL